MRILSILGAGLVAFSLLAAPARADSEEPANNTSENVFVIFNFGGFSSDGTDQESLSLKNFESPSLFILNLASVDGTIEDFVGLVIGEFGDNVPDLSEISYFVLGHITGSDHLIVSSDGDAEPLPDGFETGIIDGIRNMDNMDPNLANPGGGAFVTPDDFADQLGVDVGTFVEPNPDVPFDTVASVGDDEGVVLNGFTDPVPLATLNLDYVNGQFIIKVKPVPEPAFAALAILGIAGVLIRRRRRVAA
ncbi:MAG TPA: hypothetical protein VFY93_13165 [Planctomycetota bacterium]|nr:hypothetical protein [Planctomycetota bacterium]